MAIRFSNNAQTTLASGITASATGITVADGSVFPTLTPGDHTYVTLEDLSGNLEVVKVTAISSNTLTVTRGQDGTTARAFSQGDFAQLRVTAALLNDLADEASVTLWADVQNKPDPVITLAGDASGSVTLADLASATLTVTIADDSHTHDGRYYTETEADTRFVNVTGDTMTGTLTVPEIKGGGGEVAFSRSEITTTTSTGETRLFSWSGNEGFVEFTLTNAGFYWHITANATDGILTVDSNYDGSSLQFDAVAVKYVSSEDRTYVVIVVYENTTWNYVIHSRTSKNVGSSLTNYTSTGSVGGVYISYSTAYIPSGTAYAHRTNESARFETLSVGSISGGSLLKTTTNFGGDVSGTYNAIVIADDSHNHVISNVDGLQAALDSKLAVSSYTAADVLAKLVTVDGASSGLDADLLDGIQSSEFHRVTSDPNTPSNGTISIGNNGSYTYVQSHAGQPLRLNPLGNPLHGPSGSTIWHSGNDGSGSGLDADLLDGQQGSYYYSAGNPPPYPSDADTVDGLHAASFLRSDANDTATGIITFSNVSDAQIILDGAGTAWAGIKWSDVNDSDFIWYNGQNSTFAIGGSGANVAGKKLHVDGGLSVGSSADATATPADGIYSQGGISASGRITSTSNDYAGGIWLSPSSGDSYISANKASDTTGQVGFGWYSGGAMRWVNYLPNDATNTLHWYSASTATNVMTLTTSGNLNLTSGDLRIGGTPVIDSSRNLTNIGTISSGGITSTGNSLFYGSGSGGGAFTVHRGSDGTNAFQVYNTGEVIVGANYFYASHSAGAYFNGAIRARNGISNDQGDLTLDDNTIVTGTLQVNGAATLSSHFNHYSGHLYYDPFDSNGNHYPHFLDGANGNGVDINWRLFTGGSNTHTHTWTTSQAYFSTSLASGIDVRGPIFYDWNDTNFYVDPNGTSRINVLATTGATSTFNNGRIALRADGIEDHQTAGDGGNIQVNYYGYGNGHSYFRNFDVYNGKGSFLLQANGAGNYTRVWGSLQTTSITDTDDSSFYLNPNGTSRISLLHPSAKFSPGAAYGNSLEGNELHLMDAGSASVLQDGLQFNAAAFAVPVMYARSGSTWTNIGNQPQLCDGKASGDWGRVTLSRSYDEFIFYFGTQFGYTIFSAVTILHSTSGNSMTIYVESSESGGATDSGWTEIVNSGDTGSWPGSTTMTCQTGVGAGYNDQFRIRIVPNWSHASNTISIGQIIVRAGYGYVRRLFDWDYNKNIEFLNNTTATTSSRAPVFYDSNDTGYYVDPNGASNILNTNHYGVLRLNSSGAYMVGDATYGFRFNNNADTINALLVDNSGNSTAYLSSRAPIFYDSNDTAYYLNAAGNGTQAANINGNIRINPKSESWAEGISFNMPSQGVWGGLRWVRNYSSPFTGNWALGYIGAESSDDMGFWSYDNSVKWRLTHAGHSIVSGSSRAPIFYDSNDTTYYVDPANSTAVYSNGVVVAGNEGFQSRYWASGVRNRIWSFYNSDTYGISYHQGSAGLSGIDSIGIHPNGSTTSAGAALSVGVYTQAIGSLRAPIFYDSDNTGLFLDPSSSSLLRNVYTQNASYAFRPRYTDGSDNYSGSFHWYGLQMGNNGANYIVAGRTNPNGYLDIYVNNTSDFPTINGTHSSRFAGDGSFRNFYSVHAPIFYDSSDTGFYVDPNSTSRIRKTNMVAVGSGWDDHLNLYSADTTNRWNVLVDQGAGNAFRIAYNQSERFNIATNGEAYFTGGLRSLIYYDRDDTGYYLDPASACRVNQINFTAYNSPNAIVVGDGDVNWTFGSYSDGSSQYWMQTKFYGTNDDNRGFRVYNVANSQVEFRINGGGVAYARDSFRAPIFYDSNNTGYYVDPASGTRLGGFVGIGGSPGSDDGNWGARLNVGGAPHARFDVICQNDGIITTMYSHTGQGVGKIGTMSNHPLALMAQNGNIGGYAYSGSLRSPIFYDSDNTGYYLDPTGSSQLNTVSLGAGSKLHLVSLGDGNHFLRYISGGFSGVSIDGPQLGGHQGGELITNYGGDNWGFRWDYSGNTFSRASSRAPIFYDSNNTGYYVDPASSSVLSTLTTYGTFSTTGNIFINNSSPTIYLQDTDNRSSMIHCNSNIFYVLRASGTNSTGWATYNGYWPMELSLETNDATFGNAITAVGNITAYSDARKKKDIRPLEGGLEYLNALDAKRYKWKVDDREDIGFIAQDVEAAGLDVFVIESERKDPDTGEHIESVKSLDYGRMVSVLWQAVKEQQTQIEAMAAEIKSLKEMKQ